MRAFALTSAIVLSVVVLAGCAQEARLPDLRAIYSRTAGVDDGGVQRRPLITIPGTLGSRLEDRETGRVIWGGGSRGISADPDDPEEYRLIALPISRGDEPLRALRDTVGPAGILETAQADLLGVPIDVDVYRGALDVLAEGGFSVDRRPGGRVSLEEIRDAAVAAMPGPADAPEADDDGFDTFQFDYDWRRDLIGSAREFGRFLEIRRQAEAQRRNIPADQVKFDLLAHSMGTLISRYFLMYGVAEPGRDGTLPPITWAGARYFSRVVFVAPPNGGSVIALDNLVNGKELGPLQPFYPAPMLATHPAPYQLMPRARHNRVRRGGAAVEDLYDVALWERMGWGLLDPSVDDQLRLMMPAEDDPARRRARARLHTEKLLRRAEQFHRMMDRWSAPPAGLELFLVVGGGFETPAAASIDPESGALRIDTFEEGDGVVSRASALLDERLDGRGGGAFRSPLRFRTTLFLPDEHVELTNNRVFADNLLFWLLDAPRGDHKLERARKATLLASVADGSDDPPQSGDVFARKTER